MNIYSFNLLATGTTYQRQDEWDCQGRTGDQPALVDQISRFILKSELRLKAGVFEAVSKC